MRLFNLHLHMKSGRVCSLYHLEKYTLTPEAKGSISGLSVIWAYPSRNNVIVSTIDLSQIEWISKERGKWKFSWAELFWLFSSRR